MADKNVELDDLFVEELKPRATPISTVVATECCGVCNSSCDVVAQRPRTSSVPAKDAAASPAPKQADPKAQEAES